MKVKSALKLITIIIAFALKLITIIIAFVAIIWVLTYVFSPYGLIDRTIDCNKLVNRIYYQENNSYSLVFREGFIVQKNNFEDNITETFTFTLKETVITFNDNQYITLKNDRLYSISENCFLYLNSVSGEN